MQNKLTPNGGGEQGAHTASFPASASSLHLLNLHDAKPCCAGQGRLCQNRVAHMTYRHNIFLCNIIHVHEYHTYVYIGDPNLPHTSARAGPGTGCWFLDYDVTLVIHRESPNKVFSAWRLYIVVIQATAKPCCERTADDDHPRCHAVLPPVKNVPNEHRSRQGGQKAGTNVQVARPR